MAVASLGELKATTAYDQIVALTREKARVNTEETAKATDFFCGNALPKPAYFACHALAALGDQRAVPVLIELLNDPDLKNAARPALDVLTKQQHGVTPPPPMLDEH
jgi:hypothetical protein